MATLHDPQLDYYYRKAGLRMIDDNDKEQPQPTQPTAPSSPTKPTTPEPQGPPPKTDPLDGGGVPVGPGKGP